MNRHCFGINEECYASWTNTAEKIRPLGQNAIFWRYNGHCRFISNHLLAWRVILSSKKYNLSVSQSREAIDELKSRGDLSVLQHEELLKIIGFRNVLVHDYLELNDGIV